MTINLNIKINLSTTEDRTLIERALCEIVSDSLLEGQQVWDTTGTDGERVLAIIDDVEVMVDDPA